MRSVNASKMPARKHAWKRSLLPSRQQLEKKEPLIYLRLLLIILLISFVVHFIKGIYQLCPPTNGRNRLGRKKSKVAKNWFDIRRAQARWESSGDVVWRRPVFCVKWRLWAAWGRVWRWWMASCILGSGEWLLTACHPLESKHKTRSPLANSSC